MKLATTGGRDYRDRLAVFRRLDAIHKETPITLLIHGACCDKDTGWLCGADEWCQLWALRRGVPYVGVPARWDKYGNAAGPIRNQAIIDNWTPDAGISFPGGRGTADMVNRMKKAEIYREGPAV
jgi:hypothetical protein